MIRQIIHIDEEKCNGCGLCAHACHEGAIDIVNGKAKLVRESFCDGFGDCLPNCPTGAITFENREAPAYDQAAVAARKAAADAPKAGEAAAADDATNEQPSFKIDGQAGVEPSGCPGSRIKQFVRSPRAEERRNGCPGTQPSSRADAGMSARQSGAGAARPESELRQWPVQIKLLPTEAPFYKGAKLLIAADCTAYAYANMHEDFMRGRITLIGCPKLDMVDYYDKLKVIFEKNDIKSVLIVRMEVPCCGGLQRAAEDALKASGKFIPWQVVTISRDGRILDD